MIYALLLLTAGVSQADPPSQTIEVTAPSREKLVCRSSSRPASRMGTNRVCKTAEEWELARRETEKFMRNHQGSDINKSIGSATLGERPSAPGPK
jgi:hypothetical protein